ncbi:RNA polymerase sigma factor [Clostridium sp. B9]|uniref:RNA polymerase sigma factor n=1 Tax=Clostridium sp. B9 TaxID=3423224 RepID=UPI003D2F2D0F
MQVLIEKALKGDHEAFIEIIEKSTGQLYKAGRAILKNDNDIGDALQETIMIAYEKLHTLKEPKYFNTWLVRILINRCNYIISKNRKVISLDDVNTLTYKDNGFKNLELNEAINELKEDYRVAITLYYIMGFSVKEICSILDEKEGTIKSRLCRARSDLREFYGVSKGVK